MASNWSYFYLIRIEFLGFRYHGWQKQEGLKSVHGMIDKTFSFILKESKFKTLGCGRTDAKVSANDYPFELFVSEELNEDQLLHRLNKNLPSDIRAKSVESTSAQFNIIQDVREKDYHYYFSFGAKSHPFAAPFVRDFGKLLDMDEMMEASKLFEGTHNFARYCSKPSENTVFERSVTSSCIERINGDKASFLPDHYFAFKVRGPGFMRYQVRLMMGALVDVGRGIYTQEEIKHTLTTPQGTQMRHVAPSSGLVLNKVTF